MDIVNILFGGMGGALIAAGLAYYLERKRRKPPVGKAYELLKGLGKVLKEPEGEYYFTRSADDNFEVAAHIYAHADAEIIATTFHEDPSTYGERDLARSFKFGGSLFTRITAEEVCGSDSALKARDSMSKILKGSTLVVIPRGEAFARIEGVFCKFSDDTYVSFVVFRDPEEPSQNKGVVFRNGIARVFFESYERLIRRYEEA